MRGKEKCRILRQIRREIAENNDIEFVTSECKYQGECRGTCPKCESELAYLEAELEKRRSLGRRIALAGISIGTMAALAGCASVEDIRAAVSGQPTEAPVIEVLDGEIEPMENDAAAPTNEPEELDGYIASVDMPDAVSEDTAGIVPSEKIENG